MAIEKERYGQTPAPLARGPRGTPLTGMVTREAKRRKEDGTDEVWPSAGTSCTRAQRHSGAVPGGASKGLITLAAGTRTGTRTGAPPPTAPPPRPPPEGPPPPATGPPTGPPLKRPWRKNWALRAVRW